MPTVARAPLAVLPDASMSQSSVMVAALLGGFVVYLAFAGKLATYWSILIGGGSASTASTTSATTTGATTGSTGSTTTGSIPATQGSVIGLGGTSNPTATATGGTGTPTGTGILGLPNLSFPNFVGLGN